MIRFVLVTKYPQVIRFARVTKHPPVIRFVSMHLYGCFQVQRGSRGKSTLSISAVTAFSPPTMPAYRTSVELSALKKDDMVKILKEEFHEDVHAKWTSVELRDRLRELNRELRPGSGETSLQSMKKDQLVEEAKKLGINVTSNSTKGSLMRSIRAVREVTTGEDETIMGFGKYAEEMFKTVAQDHPEYVKWAKEVVEEDPKGCNPKLARFVKWVTLKDAATKQAGEVTEFYIGEKPTSSPPVCGFQPASSALSVKSMAKNMELAIEISYKSSAGSTFGKRRPSEKTEEQRHR